MRHRLYHLSAAILLMSAAFQSCSDGLEMPYDNPRQGYNRLDNIPSRTPSENTARTMILYSAGYNSLSSALKDDIDDICGNYLPDGYSYSDNLLVFAHHSVSDSDYSEETCPCLIEIYRDREGNTVRDTVRTWPAGTRAVDEDAATLKEVLTYIKDNYPSKEYGMVFSSHATGWLPPGYPLSRSIGQDAGTLVEIDAKTFAAAIPMKLEYLIFDACLVGGIEVAYEFKDVCEHLVFSQEEILADGLDYNNIVYRLLGTDPSDITGVAEDFYNHYNALSGSYRSATVSAISCEGLGNLAAVCSGIFSSHRDGLSEIDASAVQPMSHRSTCLFYDFRDILSQLDLSESEADAADEALGECILYKAHTDRFFSMEINTFSGLSMYLPNAVSGSTREYLDEYYRGFQWNTDSGYIQ